jgi:anaerobic ribonucleoside-triphosphate reductase activating protein
VVLGPGVRAGVWLTGCRKNCPGCLSQEFQKQKENEIIAIDRLTQEVVSLARAHQTRAVTVSGGEPFEQADELKIFLTQLREQGITDILVYSGDLLEEILPKFPWIPELVTALVDGPFDQNKPTKAIFCGSSNQRLHIFDKNMTTLYQSWSAQTQRQVQMLLSSDKIRLLGIPGVGDYAAWDEEP